MGEVYQSELRSGLLSSIKNQASKIDPQLALDLVGIIDPTPTADLVSAGWSLWRGEFVDALLGVGSSVPYVGDALAKPAKLARKYGSVAGKLGEGALAYMKGNAGDMAKLLKEIDPKAAEAAAEKAREAVRKARQDKRLGCNTEACKKVRKNNMPSKGGTWDPPNARDTGNGNWTFTDANGKQQTVPFKNGEPDFSGSYKGGGPYSISNNTADVGKDTTTLLNEHGVRQPPGTTLHHLDDGRVVFVDSAVHDAVSHSGYRSMINSQLF
jgi:hypothetical protein